MLLHRCGKGKENDYRNNPKGLSAPSNKVQMPGLEGIRKHHPFQAVAFANDAIRGIGKAPDFSIFDVEVAIRTHNRIIGQIGVMSGQDGLERRVGIHSAQNALRQIEMIEGIVFIKEEKF